MKVINIILSVLILLLAAASAVFSYFLFEKRSQFVTGWAKMATAVSNTAAELDKGSDTKSAAKLAAVALSHEKYADLDKLLPELQKQAQLIIRERDVFAKTLHDIGGNIGMKNLAELKAFQSVLTGPTSAEDVLRGVDNTVRLRNRTYVNLIRSAQRLGVKVDNAKLLDGDASAFNEMTSVFNAEKSRRSIYEQQLSSLAALFDSAVKSGEYAEDKYRQAVRKIGEAAAEFKKRYQTVVRERDNANRTIQTRDREISNLNNRIKGLNGVITDKNGQIASFQRALGIPDEGNAPMPWKPGSPEARAELRGKVTEISPNYGFIAINVGQDSVVEQTIGTRVLEISPKVEPGLEMVVARPGRDKKLEFIARVAISEVGLSQSIANIPADAKQIQVGDIVYIPPDVLKPAPKKTDAAK